MTSGPNGIDRPRWGGQVGLRQRGGRAGAEPARAREGGAVVVHISSEATALSQAGADRAGRQQLEAAPPSDRTDLSDYEVDNEKVAEAILRHYAPEIFQTLVDAGEVEE